MRFRNAFHIAIDNFSNAFKMLAYRILTGALFFSLTYLILRLGLNEIVSSPEMQTVKNLVKEFFPALFAEKSAWLQEFNTASLDLLRLLGKNIGSIVGSVIGVVAIYLVSRFANGLSVFAVAGCLSDRTSVGTRTSFSQSYFRNIGRGILYHLIHVPLSFGYALLGAALCWFLFFYMPSLLSMHGLIAVFASLSLTLTAAVLLASLKMTLISFWIPEIFTGVSVAAAFRKSLRTRKNFGRRFASYLIAIYMIIVFNVLFALCTFGSALLITLPASSLLILCLQFVHYYEDNDKKYFITFRKIATERSDD